MKYLSIADIALRWKVAERTVRNYCANGKILGARLIGKTWSIPETATQPERVNKRKKDSETLLSRLRTEKAARLSGGIRHRVDQTRGGSRLDVGTEHATDADECKKF